MVLNLRRFVILLLLGRRRRCDRFPRKRDREISRILSRAARISRVCRDPGGGSLEIRPRAVRGLLLFVGVALLFRARGVLGVLAARLPPVSAPVRPGAAPPAASRPASAGAAH